MISGGMKSFSACVHELMDAWLSGREGKGANTIYGSVLDAMPPNVVLAVVDCAAADPTDFSIEFIRRYGIATRMQAFLALQETCSFWVFRDQEYLKNTAIPALTDVLSQRRPSLSKGTTTLGGSKIAYERLLIPQKRASGRSEWCILFSKINLLLPRTSSFNADSIDLNILQLLTEGFSQKEIGLWLQLSHRTIEHRIERLKNRAGARNLQHLVAVWISNGIVV